MECRNVELVGGEIEDICSRAAKMVTFVVVVKVAVLRDDWRSFLG